MKIRSLVLVALSLITTRAVFATNTACVSRPNQSDGAGGFLTGFDCSLYHEAVYPFDLTSYITNGGASLSENALGPGYVIWTSDGTITGTWMDVLDFDPNILAGTASSQVYLSWPGGPSFPSLATVTAAGYLVLQWNPSGVQVFDPGDNLHTFTVFDLLPSASDAAFLVSYAANPAAGESYVNIINTGANGAPLFGPGLGGATGNTCVNIYAFDPGEELISCCSCLLTPNQVVNLGVNANLTPKTQTGVIPTSVVIKLVNTLAGPGGTATSCTNSAAAAGSAGFPLAPGMVAYGTTPQPIGTKYSVVEHPFIPSTLSLGTGGELASLTGRCANIVGNDSNYGICVTCRAGALGASKI